MQRDIYYKLNEVKKYLQVSEDTTALAEQILLRLDKVGRLKRKKLISCVGAAFYTACKLTGEIRSQRSIAECLNISENTIRNHSREHNKIISSIRSRNP